ncbi:hypothetical protein SK571_11145 [Lentzea sp. BCCO 10_0798]|uniref:Uncharacterized protein n=1 Tax=Lentzea kristufekii TaxID=3095430 RepID=A0ABU4TNY5_9PSEU|nr:hypothetical protein [Lentzea sp. BCCO 10_0798]MDX8049937.1 hypothetical protein [Lentzea sp. BCCO 10_0798]
MFRSRWSKPRRPGLFATTSTPVGIPPGATSGAVVPAPRWVGQ